MIWSPCTCVIMGSESHYSPTPPKPAVPCSFGSPHSGFSPSPRVGMQSLVLAGALCIITVLCFFIIN